MAKGLGFWTFDTLARGCVLCCAIWPYDNVQWRNVGVGSSWFITTLFFDLRLPSFLALPMYFLFRYHHLIQFCPLYFLHELLLFSPPLLTWSCGYINNGGMKLVWVIIHVFLWLLIDYGHHQHVENGHGMQCKFPIICRYLYSQRWGW